MKDWSSLGKHSSIEIVLVTYFYGMMTVVDSVVVWFVFKNLFPHLAKFKLGNSMWVPKTSLENFPVYEIQKPGSH